MCEEKNITLSELNKFSVFDKDKNGFPKLTAKKDFAFIEANVKGTRAHLDDIDAIISAHLKEGWQLARLMATDRNILRLAVFEMKFVQPPIPKGILINEAVELAKKYGNDDSPRFVNGILEAISN